MKKDGCPWLLLLPEKGQVGKVGEREFTLIFFAFKSRSCIGFGSMMAPEVSWLGQRTSPDFPEKVSAIGLFMDVAEFVLCRHLRHQILRISSCHLRTSSLRYGLVVSSCLANLHPTANKGNTGSECASDSLGQCRQHGHRPAAVVAEQQVGPQPNDGVPAEVPV